MIGDGSALALTLMMKTQYSLYCIVYNQVKLKPGDPIHSILYSTVRRTYFSLMEIQMLTFNEIHKPPAPSRGTIDLPLTGAPGAPGAP